MSKLIAYAIKDCRWNTVRELYRTKKEAKENKACAKCTIIKLIEEITNEKRA